MKKTLALLLTVLLAIASFSGCGSAKKITVAIPNDPTNEARALLLLQAEGIIKLKSGAGLEATVQDISSNPKNIEFVEAEAAQLPRQLKDVDYAIINSNYAISAGINPVKDSLLIEGAASAYVNIIAVKEGNESTDKIKALVAAVSSSKVKEFIESKYDGSVVFTAEAGDGLDPSVDYDALNGTSISVAASPTPHVEILEVAKEILSEKGISLEIKPFEDYVLPNEVVEAGEIDANYFQHIPYLDDFNAKRNFHLVNAGGIHVEPMGLYGGKQSDLKALK